MKNPELIIMEQGSVAIIKINRPEKKNAMSIAILEALLKAANDFSLRTDIHAIVITGTKKFFTAGMDLGDPAFLDLASAGLSEKRMAMNLAPKVCRAWEALEQITFCAVEGFCLGGGVSLAVSLDFRIMAEDSYIKTPEIDWGMNMSWGTLPRLVHLVGPARCKELIIFGEKINARTAHLWGFAEWVAKKGQALDFAVNLAAKAASKRYAAASMTKSTVNALCTALDNAVSHMDKDQFLLSVDRPGLREKNE